MRIFRRDPENLPQVEQAPRKRQSARWFLASCPEPSSTLRAPLSWKRQAVCRRTMELVPLSCSDRTVLRYVPRSENGSAVHGSVLALHFRPKFLTPTFTRHSWLRSISFLISPTRASTYWLPDREHGTGEQGNACRPQSGRRKLMASPDSRQGVCRRSSSCSSRTRASALSARDCSALARASAAVLARSSSRVATGRPVVGS